MLNSRNKTRRIELVIDGDQPGRVLVDGKEVEVTLCPWRLLNALASRNGEAVKAYDLCAEVWDRPEHIEPNQIWFQVRQANKCLGVDVIVARAGYVSLDFEALSISRTWPAQWHFTDEVTSMHGQN